MYAGILIDTDNFLSKTGVRTFEAAAFLKRSGADVMRVRKMFRTDIETYRQKAEGVSRIGVSILSAKLEIGAGKKRRALHCQIHHFKAQGSRSDPVIFFVGRLSGRHIPDTVQIIFFICLLPKHQMA